MQLPVDEDRKNRRLTMPCAQKDMIGKLVTEANSYGPDGSVAAELILKIGENVEQRLACLCRMYREGHEILVPHVVWVEMSRTNENPLSRAYRLNSNGTYGPNHVLRQNKNVCRLLINGQFVGLESLDKGPIQPGAVMTADMGHKLTEEQGRAFFPHIKGKGKPPKKRGTKEWSYPEK